jgi:light-harvesting complex 1 beta chain
MSGIMEPRDIQTRDVSLSGLTIGEAQEFNKLFVLSFIIFTGIAIIAHILVWLWRPWIPGPHGYSTALLLHAQGAVQLLSSHLA